MKELLNRHWRASGKIERRRMHKKEWLVLGFVVLAALVAGFFVLSQVGLFLLQQEAQMEQQTIEHNQETFDRNVAKSDSTPEKTYEIVRRALQDGDVETVIDYIHPNYRWKYEEGLREADNEGRLSDSAERMTPLAEVIREYGNVIRYSIEPIPGNDAESFLNRYSEEVEFIQDIDGVWKISSI